MKQPIINTTLIASELAIGSLLGQIYINQYNFWTSEQTIEQFLFTVALVYMTTVFALGLLHLRLLGKFKLSIIIRCCAFALLFGMIFTLPLSLSDFTFHFFNAVGLSSLVLALIGMVVGFNFMLLLKK